MGGDGIMPPREGPLPLVMMLLPRPVQNDESLNYENMVFGNLKFPSFYAKLERR